MKKLPFLLGFFICLILITGCHRTNHRKVLRQVDSLSHVDIDSALTLMNALEEHLSELSEEERMLYVWLRAKAHFDQYVSMAEDSLLPKAVNYFSGRGDTAKMMDGYLLKAGYLYWGGRLEEALAVLDSGIAQARIRRDSLYVSDFLYQQSLYIYELQRDYSAVSRLMKQALSYDPATASSSRKAKMTYFLAINLGLINDSSFHYYYEKSISMAETLKDTAALCHYMRNYATTLGRHDTGKSKALIRRVWELSPQYRDNLPITQMVMAENFLRERNPDSAAYYLNIAFANEKKSEKRRGVDICLRLMFYELRNMVNYALGKDISTIDAGRLGDSLILANVNQRSTMTRQMETKLKLERQNYTLIIERQRIRLLLMIVSFLLLAVGGGAFFYVRNRRIRLAEAEDRIETLTRLLEDADKANGREKDGAFFKKLLLQQLGIIRLVATAPTSQNQELLRRISGITNKEVPVESLLVWEDLYPVIDRIYDGFYTRMDERYGDLLSEKEKQTCCLLCAEFSTKEIGVVTQQSVASVYVRKTAIRKKLGMGEKEDIVGYIRQA